MNIQGATEKVEKTIDISKYLPEGVSLVDDAAKNVTATATSRKMEPGQLIYGSFDQNPESVRFPSGFL